jgi:signal transduction histidine kinase
MRSNLRDLARGIYPPLLADKGLAEALTAQARKASIPIHVESAGIGRYPQEIESALYFLLPRGAADVAKYANATRVDVRSSESADELALEVQDDGQGFDASGEARERFVGHGRPPRGRRRAARDPLVTRVGDGGDRPRSAFHND